MALVAFLLVLGSALLAVVITVQIRSVAPNVGPLLLYYVKVLPVIFLANASLGYAFVRAHQTVKNLPLLVSFQSVAYYICLLVLSIIVLGDKVSVPRVLAGFALMGAGIFMLKG